MDSVNTRTTHWARKVLPAREQAQVRDRWLLHRLDTVLPRLMEKEGLDMWIVIAREYNEDPVLLTLSSATTLSARRRTMLVFSKQSDGTVDRLMIARSGPGRAGLYKGVWKADEDQWEALARVVAERDPSRIGVNVSDTFAFGDGLSHTEYNLLSLALGPQYMTRVQFAENLAVGWLEERTQEELAAYPTIVGITHEIIEEAFSDHVVHPGITTASDVGWWMRQRIIDLGLRAWFQPYVDVQRKGAPFVPGNEPVMPGDVLHCDIGFHYLGLATDVQRLAYIPKRGETQAPPGLRAALAAGNRLQDIHGEAFLEGRTGNEILAATLAKANAEGLTPCIYSHPIGYHGHGAGPTIGLFDQQGGVPGRGDYRLRENTCYAMELNARTPVPEWDGQVFTAALEEDIVFTGGKVHFLAGRQTSFYLI